MSIRAVARHHGVGWHRNILGLVRAHSERVAQRRRAGPVPCAAGGRNVDSASASVCDGGGLRGQRRGVGDDPRPYESILRRAGNLSDAHQEHLDRLFDAHPRLRTA